MRDLIIIGGGPSGINVAISAHRAGLDYLLIEKGVIANSLYNFPVNMTFFSTSLKLEIQDTPFISHQDKPTRAEALEYYRRLVQSFDLDIHLYETVERMDPLSDEGYRVTTDKDSYDTPRYMHIAGEELPKVRHYYDDPHVYIGQKVLVVGAANSACDAALECYRKGAEVTMAIRGDRISDRVKYWIKPDIENRIKEGSITAYFNTSTDEIRPKEVVLGTPDGPLTLANDFVLAMTGYQPNYELFERLRLPIQESESCKPVFDPNTLETSLPGVYMAGVACGGMETSKLFIENTRDHGQIIVDGILHPTRAIAG